jgi:AcrR family transcriptional regulator
VVKRSEEPRATRAVGPEALQDRGKLHAQRPFEDMTPASRRIVAAAAKLLTSDGPRSVTMERVAAEAKVNKWTIRNNFGSKSALLGVACDYYLHDQCVRLAAELSGVKPEERARRIAEGIKRMVSETEARGYFNVVPLAFRDEDLRARFVSLYEWWYQLDLLWLGYEDGSETPPSPQEIRTQRGAAQLMVALVDGLWLQTAIHREQQSLESAFEALALLLSRGLEEAAAEILASDSQQPVAPDVPLDDFPLGASLEENLTPASQRILIAAAEILDTDGPRGLTMDRVATRAQVNRWTVRNNFGNKAALLSAAADFFLHDKCVGLTRELSDVDPAERPARIARGVREMILQTDPRGYFLTLPLALHDEALRRRWIALYRWWYQQNDRWLGIDTQIDDENARRSSASHGGMARLLTAIVDGLWLQVALIDEFEEIEPAFTALEVLLARGLVETPHAPVPKSE